jgi:coenzyme F420-reducing hydrogenase delta subunit
MSNNGFQPEIVAFCCHYCAYAAADLAGSMGNLNARRRVEYSQQLLEDIGLEGRRIQMINLSSAMGGQFA